jgi:hypothetical protein
MDSKVVILLSKVCAFCDEEGHAIMDYPFMFFHIKASIARHVELQDMARTLMDRSQDQKLRIFVG